MNTNYPLCNAIIFPPVTSNCYSSAFELYIVQISLVFPFLPSICLIILFIAACHFGEKILYSPVCPEFHLLGTDIPIYVVFLNSSSVSSCLPCGFYPSDFDDIVFTWKLIVCMYITTSLFLFKLPYTKHRYAWFFFLRGGEWGCWEIILSFLDI